MSTSMRTKALQLLILLSLVSQTLADSARPRETNPPPGLNLANKLQLANEYEAFFRQHVSKEHFLGAAFVVVSGDQIIHLVTTGHTDTSREQPINENTIFRVASVSKTFAAGLTGVLVTEGQFSWDDPVNRYVPEFQINGDTQQVLIRHLLGQSTGLIPHAYDNLIEDGVSLDKIQDQYRKLSYICKPGQCYSYQNSVFSLIEPVIEEATTKSYAALMEEKIFRPLDMRTASVGYEPFINNANHAKPHVLIKKGTWKTVRVLPNYYRIAPAAGVNASALDMGKWLMAQLGSNPEVYKPEMVDILTRPRVKTWREKHRRYWKEMITDAHYGLGWRIYQLGENQLAYHSGWVSGYRADVAWSEQYDLGFAILLNEEANSINELTTTFWEMAFASLAPVQDAESEEMLATTGGQ
jgi:beta-lactamase class C